MRIDIVAIGSRGDVQPFVALGLGLQNAGHRVRIVTLDGFEDFVCGRGLEHLAIGGSPSQIANTTAGRDWVKKRSSTGGFLRGFVGVARSRIQEGITRYWSACQGVEALIVSPMGLLVGIHIAERLGVPMIQAQVEPPTVPTRYDWHGRKDLRSAVRSRWASGLDVSFHFLLWCAIRQSTNNARSEVLDLPALSLCRPFGALNRKRRLLLCGLSPAVIPKPRDSKSWIHHTGYWLLDDVSGWTPPWELEAFLESGPQPVFIGFGSTPFPNPEASTELVVRALTRAGRRGILVAGGSGLLTGRLSETVFGVGSAPYDWLFSKVCAAVHQGGAGVTAAALRAGLPSVVVPVFGVHPFWANRVFELGVGPRPIPAPQLTESNLTDAIQATSDPEMRHRARVLGEKICREDGVGRAVELVHEYLGAGIWKAVEQEHAR